MKKLCVALYYGLNIIFAIVFSSVIWIYFMLLPPHIIAIGFGHIAAMKLKRQRHAKNNTKVYFKCIGLQFIGYLSLVVLWMFIFFPLSTWHLVFNYFLHWVFLVPGVFLAATVVVLSFCNKSLG